VTGAHKELYNKEAEIIVLFKILVAAFYCILAIWAIILYLREDKNDYYCHGLDKPDNWNDR
jgi:hypothetical protein